MTTNWRERPSSRKKTVRVDVGITVRITDLREPRDGDGNDEVVYLLMGGSIRRTTLRRWAVAASAAAGMTLVLWDHIKDWIWTLLVKAGGAPCASPGCAGSLLAPYCPSCSPPRTETCIGGTTNMPTLIGRLNEHVTLANEGTMKGKNVTKAKDNACTEERIHLLLGKTMVARLEKLKERVEPSTRTEVFRISLRLLEDVVNQLDKGGELLVRDKDGNLHPYQVYLA